MQLKYRDLAKAHMLGFSLMKEFLLEMRADLGRLLSVIPALLLGS